MKQSELKKIYDYLMSEFKYGVIGWSLSKSEKTIKVNYYDYNNDHCVITMKVSDII